MPQTIDRQDYQQVGIYRTDHDEPRYGFIESVRGELHSSGHYGYPRFNRPDVGGNYHSVKTVVINQPAQVHIRGSFSIYKAHHYIGKLFAVTNPLSLKNPIDYSAESYGAEAYARMKPTAPSFSGLNALYELKDLPGMLRQRLSSIKDIGNYYLALKFGWEPLLRDIRNLVNTQRNMERRLNQLIRDNGKPVRRRVTLYNLSDDPVITTGSGGTPLGPGFVTYFYGSGQTWRRKEKHMHRVWASAQFRYWLPDGPRDIAWKRRMLAKLYGLEPSPAVIWNAIPWSWLIDWFSNAGDVISNLDSGVADRCASDYAYVMREDITEVEFSAEGYFFDANIQPVKLSASTTLQSISRSRHRGSPFGFSVSQESLTGTQLSILGALGLSRI